MREAWASRGVNTITREWRRAQRQRRASHARSIGVKSSPVNTPQKQRKIPVQCSNRKSVTFRTSLTGLSVKRGEYYKEGVETSTTSEVTCNM